MKKKKIVRYFGLSESFVRRWLPTKPQLKVRFVRPGKVGFSAFLWCRAPTRPTAENYIATLVSAPLLLEKQLRIAVRGTS